jgi:hypothetical protein
LLNGFEPVTKKIIAANHQQTKSSGWVDGWVGSYETVLWIAYSNQKENFVSS